MEWRIVYVQKPMNHNPRHVEFVEAATKEEAAAIARDRIERRTGIAFNAHLGWAFELVTQVETVKTPVDDGPSFDVYRGQDGVMVVHIDTHGMPENVNGPIIRVYINDDPNPVFYNAKCSAADEVCSVI